MERSSREIKDLANRLEAALEPYILCIPAVRDALLEEHGREMIQLHRFLHVLTRSRMEREHLIVAESMFLEEEHRRKAPA